MKNTITTLLLVTAFFSQAQVGIGVAPESIEPSAQLEVKSTSKGFLPPRMLAAERDLITSPVAGLLIYQTDAPAGLYYYTGSTWDIVNTGSAAVSSIGAFGTATPNGATIASGELKLAPANATNGGVVTTGVQTFAGNKTLNNDLTVNGQSNLSILRVAGDATFSGGLRVENKPFLPTKLNQSQINGLTGVEEGMVVYNTDTRKLQLFSVGASDAINDSFTGTFTDRLSDFEQTFIPPTTGIITAIQFFVKSETRPSADVRVTFVDGSGGDIGSGSGSINFVNIGSPEWMNIPVSNIPVTAGQTFTFLVRNWLRANFGSNSNYFNGGAIAGCCGPINGDDVMFKILITPTNGSTAYWLNMN